MIPECLVKPEEMKKGTIKCEREKYKNGKEMESLLHC